MHRVLILARLFPPENRAAANRAYSWALTFKKLGIYPVIITRDWAWTKFEVTHKKFEGYEVYYVPFKQRKSYRFKARANFWSKKLGGLFHLWGYLFQHSFWNQPDGRLYSFAKEYLKNNRNEFDSLIVTAPPFIYLKMGYLLSSKFSLPWLADYRDEWNSEGSIFKKDPKRPVVLRLIDLVKAKDSKLEETWTSNSSKVTTVSSRGAANLGKILKRTDVYSVPNGFLSEDFVGLRPKEFDKLTFTYAGTLHGTQEIEPFLDAVKLSLSSNRDLPIQLVFIGLANDLNRLQYIKNYLGQYDFVVNATKKVSKKESLELQAGSHYLLLFRHRAISDIPSSKLYEYAGLRRPVIHYPTDKGIMENTLKKTGQFVEGLTSTNDLAKYLGQACEKFKAGEWATCQVVDNEIKKLDRSSRAEEMAKIVLDLR